MKVLKFGGTSLGSADRMRAVAGIVASHQPCWVVLSAVSGTTDSLQGLSQALSNEEIDSAANIVDSLKSTYANHIDALFESHENTTKARAIIAEQFDDIESCLQLSFVPALEKHLLAKGELISTELFSLLLEELSVAATLVNSLDLIRLTREGVPDEQYLRQNIKQVTEDNSSSGVFVSQGFICRDAFGEVSNLKRGGSDYSASLYAAALNADELQIWTDIDGMHNNDPRFVSGTRPIRELSFDEAAELAYFGAKILHPASIRPARRKLIPVKLLNTMSPESTGTLITQKTERAQIKAVAAKSGITAIKIRSSEMLQAPGFLRRIFEVFELYQTSIDTITTSEVAVSVTIDDSSHLKEICRTLEEFGHVEVDENLCIICVVGEFMVETKGIAAKVTAALKEVPVRMISYGGSSHNMTFLIAQDDKEKALNELHRSLFNVQ